MPPRATPVTRTQDNTADSRFCVKFVERVYDGAPRWWEKAWERHYTTPSGPDGHRLDRDKDVKSLLGVASTYKTLFNARIPYLISCVNPDCPLRQWATIHFLAVKKSFVIDENNQAFDSTLTHEQRESFMADIRHGLEQMAKGKRDQLSDACPRCGHKLPVFPVSGITDKWVYVLKEKKPYYEIHLDTPVSGSIADYRGGQFKHWTTFDGRLWMDRATDSDAWYFFLSPVQLGPKALDLLTQSADRDASDYSVFDAHPSRWNVGIIPELQPWSTTVKRVFHARQRKTRYEFIPLVDPFSWVSQIIEFDYLPILEAQQALIRSDEEQAKAFVAATLLQVIGRQQVSDNPPKFENDNWHVAGELVPPPPEFSGSGNIAKAWLDRYQSALQFLTSETDCACCRVWFPVRYSLAHRIVELACQEAADKPEYLAFALAHWAHILRNVLLSKTGESFVAWVAANGAAAARVPQKNVLGGEGLKAGSSYARKYGAEGASLPAHILAAISPVILAGSRQPAKDMQAHLGLIGIEAKTFGTADNLLKIKNLGLSISGAVLTNYANKTSFWGYAFNDKGSLAEISGTPVARGGYAGKQFIDCLASTKLLEDIVTLLQGVAKWGEPEKEYQTDWDRYGETKEKLETGVKIAEFIDEQTMTLLKAQMQHDQSEYAELVETQGRKAAKTQMGSKLSAEWAEAMEKDLSADLEKGISTVSLEDGQMAFLRSARSVRAFEALQGFKKVLAGPVALVLGGADAVIQLGQSRQAMENGDPTAAAAHSLTFFSDLLVIAVATAETAALVTGAGAVAWAGPVGWIAAALMLLAALMMALGAKNDLQLYAEHCFLGAQYAIGPDAPGGKSATGLAWMGGDGWNTLVKPAHARLALLRLLTAFTTFCTTQAENYRKGLFIFPGYCPSGAFFEVEITLTSAGQNAVKEKYKAVIFPLGVNYRGREPNTHVWRNAGHGIPDYAADSVRVFRQGEQVEHIEVSVSPKTFRGMAKRDFRVRLVYDGAGKNTLPIHGWVENKDYDIGVYNTTSSGEAHEEESGHEASGPGEGARHAAD